MTQGAATINNKKLSFLFISSDKYPPFRVDVAVLFGKELVERGHNIDWVLQSDENCRRSYVVQQEGGRVWVGKTDNGASRLARLKKHIYGITNDLRVFPLARKKDYDFVQVKDKFVSALFSIIVARLHKKKFFFWLSYPFPEAALYAAKIGTARYPIFYKFKGTMLKHLLYKIILPNADHIFVQSNQMRRDLRDCGVEMNKMTPVPMGVSLDEIPYKNTDTAVKSETIVYLGTLVKARRVDFLITVLGIVKKSIPGAVLYLVGDGEDPSDRDVITEKVNELGLQDSVYLTGFLPRDEALKYIEKAGVCVSPFFPTPILNSTSPTKLVEYMAMGRPVVANDHPEQQLIIEESRAGICVSWKEKEFASAIVNILTDRQMAERMGERGRKYVEARRSYKRIADDVEKQYYKMCNVN